MATKSLLSDNPNSIIFRIFSKKYFLNSVSSTRIPRKELANKTKERGSLPSLETRTLKLSNFQISDLPAHNPIQSRLFRGCLRLKNFLSSF